MQNELIATLEKENAELKAREEARCIVKIPLTSVVITTEHAQGAAAVGLIWLIVLL
ncbi:MAG: hypothetical protein LBD99_06570 [Candidatus Margulisbacteria bacterium]|jgi:hypothetical protein|nr:hypothetical protein [Candidatus Margulisiibacteriota bacterium]